MAAADHTAVSARSEIQEYPWHADLWSNIAQDLTRVHHALLLHGQAGLGKEAFALRLARAALCHNRRDADACGTCRSCALFAAGTHPDFLYVRPEDDSDNILVDQIRPVTEFFSLKPHISPRKVVVVSPADTMNVSAANSLLKVLEEPPAGSLLILVATHVARMPATVRSRCMRLTLSPPSRDAARAWLAGKSGEASAMLDYAAGSPLLALTLAETGFAEKSAQLGRDLAALAARREDPIACAMRWKTLGTADCLDWLQRSVADAIFLTMSPNRMNGPEYSKFIATFSLPVIDLFGFLDIVSSSRRLTGTGVDENLVLETALLRWCEITATAV